MGAISGSVNMSSLKALSAILTPADIDELAEMGWKADISPINDIWLVHIDDVGLISFEHNGAKLQRYDKEIPIFYTPSDNVSLEIMNQKRINSNFKNAMKEIGFKYP